MLFIPVYTSPGFTCALQKEILYQGKLFVSENWICFHSKVFGKDTKVGIFFNFLKRKLTLNFITYYFNCNIYKYLYHYYTLITNFLYSSSKYYRL